MHALPAQHFNVLLFYCVFCVRIASPFFIIRLIKYWLFFFFNFLFISFSSVSLHQHIISNAIRAQNAPTHNVFMSHFCVSRFAVIHYSPDLVVNFFCVSVIHFSVSLSSPLSMRSPFIDRCSFKGSRDAGLNQRRTRYIYTLFNLFFPPFIFSWVLMKKLRRACNELCTFDEARIGSQQIGDGWNED